MYCLSARTNWTRHATRTLFLQTITMSTPRRTKRPRSPLPRSSPSFGESSPPPAQQRTRDSSLPPSSPPPAFSDTDDGGALSDRDAVRDVDIGDEDEEGEDLFGEGVLEEYAS